MTTGLELHREELKLLFDLIKYVNTSPETMANAMHYDFDRFNKYMRLLEKACDNAKRKESSDVNNCSFYIPDEEYY